jgi:hypothetical protein
MKQTTLGLLIFVATSMVIFQSCYPGEELTYEDTDIVATFYENETNFAALLTYAMPDSVFHISDSTLVSGDVNRTYDQQILTNIEENLLALGFTEAVNAVDADVHVVALATTTTWVSGGCYYSYWYYYYPYCYPVVYTYTTGSVIIVMATNDPGNNTAVWVAGMNGLLDDSFSTNASARIDKNIDQAFAQSPYLGEGK